MTEITSQPCSQAAMRPAESSLVDGFRRGDAVAFEQIVTLYWKQVHTLANRLLTWPGEVEDVVQDVFVSALTGHRKFCGRSSLKTWLFAITVNACRSRYYREALRRRFLFRQAARQRGGPEGQAPDFEPVRRAVAALPVKYRQVIVLKYLQECDTKEIMDILKISESTLNTRLFRGRQLLKDALTDWDKKDE